MSLAKCGQSSLLDEGASSDCGAMIKLSIRNLVTSRFHHGSCHRHSDRNNRSCALDSCQFVSGSSRMARTTDLRGSRSGRSQARPAMSVRGRDSTNCETSNTRNFRTISLSPIYSAGRSRFSSLQFTRHTSDAPYIITFKVVNTPGATYTSSSQWAHSTLSR